VIEGLSIRLRPWRESDVDSVMSLRNDVALQAKLLARALGSDESQVRQWLVHRSGKDSGILWIIADRTTDAALGYLQITGIDPEDRNADLGICLAPAAQGKGLGSEALRLALANLRDTYGLRKINLRVRADNQPAIRCYTRLGFEQCGLLKAHVRIAGQWLDVVLMELFLTDWSGRCA
jgi:RimJ/RimL family protein N-acetyltransferase